MPAYLLPLLPLNLKKEMFCQQFSYSTWVAGYASFQAKSFHPQQALLITLLLLLLGSSVKPLFEAFEQSGDQDDWTQSGTMPPSSLRSKQFPLLETW